MIAEKGCGGQDENFVNIRSRIRADGQPVGNCGLSRGGIWAQAKSNAMFESVQAPDGKAEFPRQIDGRFQIMSLQVGCPERVPNFSLKKRSLFLLGSAASSLQLCFLGHADNHTGDTVQTNPSGHVQYPHPHCILDNFWISTSSC